MVSTTLPGGGVVTHQYTLAGLLNQTSGARTYPAGYSYDAQGRLKTMTNWSGFATGTGARVTTWNYDHRGFLTNKSYHETNGPRYGYTAPGRLRTRTWVRGVTTTYATNASGELVGISYSDGVTPSVTCHLDRLGRRTNIVDGAGSHDLTYSDAGQLLVETNVSGTLAGLGVTYAYDSLNRRSNLSLHTASSAVSNEYAYDSAARLTNVSDGTYSAGYSYLANSALIGHITFRSNGVTRMATTRQYDYLNRLRRVETANAQQSTVAACGYWYNSANQRVRSTLADGSYWVYDYDALGQVISGKRHWADGTPVVGQQFEYGFDDIGNRTLTKAGGDAVGDGLRAAAYGPNTLNQYTNRQVPGWVDVLGAAHALASVTNNGQGVYRKGEYFHSALSLNNTSGPVWATITTTATLTNTTQTNLGHLFLPQTPEAFGYDADGNLTNDGRFVYTWDGENRLVLVESHADAPTGSKVKVAWEYDAQGRRLRQTEYDGSSGSYVIVRDLKLVYDGWQCLAELNATNHAVLRSYLWGLDVSSSRTGAGGVGGLVAINSAAQGVHFYCHDGNGNVTALVNATNGAVSARYEYSPFGELIRATGPLAEVNPFRFSTKYQHDETGLCYYGYRYYDPSTGRWLSRDPIFENGGRNLYALLQNAAINKTDRLGLEHYVLHDPSEAGDPIGDIDVLVDTTHLCTCGRAGRITIRVVYSVDTPVSGEPADFGDVFINGDSGAVVRKHDEYTFVIEVKINRPECPSVPQAGQTYIAVQSRDVLAQYRNEENPDFTGVFNSFAVAWNYSCKSISACSMDNYFTYTVRFVEKLRDEANLPTAPPR